MALTLLPTKVRRAHTICLLWRKDSDILLIIQFLRKKTEGNLTTALRLLRANPQKLLTQT